MTQAHPDPEPPTPPGAADREVDIVVPDDEGRKIPDNEDVAQEAGATEPPD